MAEVTTCSLCNAPLRLNGDRVGSYYNVRAEAVDFQDRVRGKGSFTFKICNDCLERVLLTPSDEAEKEFKEKMD